MSARPPAFSTWASASISAASVPGRGAIHLACASAGVSSRIGLTETDGAPYPGGAHPAAGIVPGHPAR